jgi:hypothetical protein
MNDDMPFEGGGFGRDAHADVRFCEKQALLGQMEQRVTYGTTTDPELHRQILLSEWSAGKYLAGKNSPAQVRGNLLLEIGGKLHSGDVSRVGVNWQYCLSR